jgi:hypothetical protein
MLHSKHLLHAAAIAGIFLGTGRILAAGTTMNRAAADARLMAEIPATAQAVVIIHDMSALDKKVAGLAQKLKIPVLPPSLRHIEKTLNLPRGITADGTAAIVMIPDGHATHTVMILPTKQAASALANMNFSTGKDGLSHGQLADGADLYAMAGKGCIMVSNDRGALIQFKSVGTPITPMLTESEQPLADQSDVYVLVNTPAIRTHLEKAMAKTNAADGTSSKGADIMSIAKKAALRIVKDTHSTLIGMRISHAAITLSMVSDEKAGSQVAQALACLRPLPAKPLMGLPDSKNLMGVSAGNIDGVRAAHLLLQWEKSIPANELHNGKTKIRIHEFLRKFSNVLKLSSSSAAMIRVSGDSKKPAIQDVQIANSTDPALSAELENQLITTVTNWVSAFQMSVPGAAHFKTTVARQKVIIAGLPFTEIKQTAVLPAGGTPEDDALRQSLKMQQNLMGTSTQTYLIGSTDKQMIIGSNCGHKLIAATIKAAGAGSDVWDADKQIVAASRHLPANSSLAVYLDLSSLFAALTQRVEAMANMTSPMVKMPATEPMSMSLAVKNNVLTGQWRMPMKNLEQLSARIHALLPLAMMLEMQAMQGNQAGQGGAGQPQ